MIELREGNYLYAIWFVPFNGGDFMACIFKDGEYESKAPWELRYRFRYHKDDKIFWSEDEKSCTSAKAKDGSPEMLKTTEKALQSMIDLLLKKKKLDHFEKLPINGDVKKFIKVVEKEKPDWLHMQTVEPIPEEE